MMRSETSEQTWLQAAAIAAAAGGRVARSGGPARRIVTDSRIVERGDCFVAVVGDNFDGHDFVDDALQRGAVGLVVAAPLPRRAFTTPAFVVRVNDTRAALLGIAAEHRRRHAARVVGITGSCGKTSTKDMLGHVLDAAMPTVRSPQSFNNDIGVPLTLFRIGPDTAAAVVEIGCSGPGEIARLAGAAAPDIAIVTCVAQAHLAGLRTVGGVAEEKSALVASLREDGVAVLNGDDAACRNMAARTRAPSRFVRVDGEADWWATHVEFNGLGTTFRLHRADDAEVLPVTLPRMGTHNVYNALLTIAAAHELGVPLPVALEALCRIPASGRRLECKQAGAITVFDDTYNMNPASARAALHALAGLHGSGRKFVVFGRMLDLGESSDELHRALGRDVAQAGVHCLMAVGDGMEPLVAGARGAGMDARNVACARDPLDALDRLLGVLQPGDVVLCKASRRVALDRLVDGLLARLGGSSSGRPSG
jgi:UDP-N-acetylmuramoyl-tripeptide--D-alanyl-D-alanine ligase